MLLLVSICVWLVCIFNCSGLFGFSICIIQWFCVCVFCSVYVLVVLVVLVCSMLLLLFIGMLVFCRVCVLILCVMLLWLVGLCICRVLVGSMWVFVVGFSWIIVLVVVSGNFRLCCSWVLLICCQQLWLIEVYGVVVCSDCVGFKVQVKDSGVCLLLLVGNGVVISVVGIWLFVWVVCSGCVVCVVERDSIVSMVLVSRVEWIVMVIFFIGLGCCVVGCLG